MILIMMIIVILFIIVILINVIVILFTSCGPGDRHVQIEPTQLDPTPRDQI